MKYDPEIHHRRSIRLKDYDYSTAGAYFITICTYKRQCILGEVLDGEVRLNALGDMVTTWWLKLGEKFAVVAPDACVIMPNHVHRIIRLVGADPCVRPHTNPCVAAKHARGTHMRVPLPRIVQWFKTMTTNQHVRMTKKLPMMPFSGRLWQRNYYEHVIRNEKTLSAIREYIKGNPSRWQEDPENPDAGG